MAGIVTPKSVISATDCTNDNVSPSTCCFVKESMNCDKFKKVIKKVTSVTVSEDSSRGARSLEIDTAAAAAAAAVVAGDDNTAVVRFVSISILDFS